MGHLLCTLPRYRARPHSQVLSQIAFLNQLERVESVSKKETRDKCSIVKCLTFSKVLNP
jgi:hypothetical protein